MVFRSAYESQFRKTGLTSAYLTTWILGIIFQFTGQWVLMILAGALGSHFVRRLRYAFAGGFLGIGTAWSAIFLFLVNFSGAYEVSEYLVTLAGAPGLGRFVVSVSILMGGLLGASGAVVGRLLFDIIGEFRNSKLE